MRFFYSNNDCIPISFDQLFSGNNYEGLARLFVDGDVIYGIQETLDESEEAFYQYHPERCNSEKEDMILRQSQITSQVWNNRYAVSYNSDYQIHKDVKDVSLMQRLIAYRAFLSQHQKYNLQKLTEFDRAQMSALGISPSHLDGYESDSSSESESESSYGPRKLRWERDASRQTMMWKKASKGGLEFQLMHRQRVVHFLIEKLDIESIAKKSGDNGKSITASELRWLYRHRNMPAVQQGLWFWSRSGALSHDMVFGHLAWERYMPKNVYW